jgi:hypothetical protein
MADPVAQWFLTNDIGSKGGLTGRVFKFLLFISSAHCFKLLYSKFEFQTIKS